MMFWVFVLSSVVTLSSCDFGLINLLYWKADANLDHIISKAELQTIWHDFDKNEDQKVTREEFIPRWKEVTGHSQEKAAAYFILADLNDDEIINQTDIDALYHLFDRDRNGEVSPEEFSQQWQKIIMDMPFAVMFEHGDFNKNDVLSESQFIDAFLFLDVNNDKQLTEGEFSSQWMAHGLGASHQSAELFKQLDVNRDHVINEVDLKQLITRYDTSRDKLITLDEFIKMSALVPPLTTTSRLVRSSEIQYEVYLFDSADFDNSSTLDRHELSVLFSIFDANNDSFVTEIEFKSEWVTYLKLGSEAQASRIFQRADYNGDKVLTQADMGQVFKYFDPDSDDVVSLNEFLTQWGALKLGPVNPVVIG